MTELFRNLGRDVDALISSIQGKVNKLPLAMGGMYRRNLDKPNMACVESLRSVQYMQSKKSRLCGPFSVTLTQPKISYVRLALRVRFTARQCSA
jgi:hypothetical protein